ncbi:Nbs-lrr resistance protein [Hibiscus syriacus]|uniref:Nbs-lrr resistance protein n=1 Tax=Hibiscus syriacus TaxID=106335 RepID=A0A6A2XNT8_HIBSY|nr:Nbs-lrr resistance protein [Hibiscus syriacus]
MAELVGPILDVIKFIGRSASKYIKYQRKFTDYVDDFQRAQADLQSKEADIQHVEHKVGAGKYLFCFCLGKLVNELTQAMKEVRTEGHFYGSLVVNDPSNVAVNLPTLEVVGSTDVREEIYQYLMGDEIGMIGVCGMGGIGKTTIMKDVHNRLLKESKFRKLIWVTVSQEFDIRRLQTNIECQLGGNLSDDEDTIVRAGKLSNMLGGQGRYVLILDDVWKSFSLEDIGILETTSNDGCKIVLTTRAERVAQSMGFKKVRVPCLSMEEAMDLFLSKVGQDVLLNPTLESFMNLVVRECDGLPLAIVTLAGCMRGISNPRVWENAIDELRGYIRNLHDMEDKVYGCLKFSYDRLEQTDKDCFLCCAFYPEDCEIGKEEIIEYWIEAGLIDEMGSRKAMEHCGHSILQKLEENCLLERVQEIGKGTRLSWFSSSLYIEKDTHIKMHDLVRDMALHITRKRFMVKAGKQLKELPHEEEWSEDLETVSLMHNSISTIPQTMKCPKFPRLTSLLLSRNSLKEIPNSFFDHFPNLKILDLSYNHFESLPNSISSLEKLTVLLPTACYLLKSLPSLSKLQALKKLDIGFSGVEEMPKVWKCW